MNGFEKWKLNQTQLEEKVKGNIEKRDQQPEEPRAEIEVQGREADESEIVRPAKPFIKKLVEYGWEYKVGYSKAKTPPRYRKGGEDKGDLMYDSKIVELCWVEAVRGSDRLRVTWKTTDGKTVRDSGTNNRQWGLLNTAEMKEFVEREK